MNETNKKVRAGVLWNLLAISLSKGASTFFMLALAAYLDPDSFGLIAMATVAFELASIFVESGLGRALIRKKGVSQSDLSTAFITNLAFSIIAFCLVYIAAPYLADFYGKTELKIVIQVMAVSILINATKVVQIAVITRKLDFKTQMYANVISVVLSGFLSIAMAIAGLGVWSLVAQMLCQSLVSSMVLWVKSDWKPSFHFDKKSFLELFGFSKNLMAEGFLDVIYRNSYFMVLGRFYSAEAAGLYFLSKKISDLVSKQLTMAGVKASFPAMAKIQDNNAELKDHYRKIVQWTLYFIAPTMLVMASISDMFFLTFMGEEWLEAAPIVQVLCGVGLLFPMHAINVNLLSVKGRSDLILKLGLMKKFVNFSLLIASVKYGVFAVVLSQLIGSALSLIPNIYYSNKMIGYSFRMQLRDAASPILCSFIAAATAYMISRSFVFEPEVGLFFSAMGAFMLYVVLSYFFKVPASLSIVNLVRDRVLRSSNS